MEDIWFDTTLLKRMPHLSANIKSNHKAHKTEWANNKESTWIDTLVEQNSN